MTEKIIEAIFKAEKAVGSRIDNDVIAEVIEHTIRKCRLIGKDMSYFPLLLETELVDHVNRQAINAAYSRKESVVCAQFA